MKKINSILSYNDEDENIERTVFHIPPVYGDKVKIHDCSLASTKVNIGFLMILLERINRQIKTLAEPRDNVDIFPPKGNLHKSSYHKLGSEEESIKISETHAMLSQIKLKDEHRPITFARRSLLTMQSLASAEKDYEEKELRLPDILLDPIAFCQMDYRTTVNIDYRSPHPPKPKPPPLPPSPEPWLLNRRTIGYSLQDLENRCGYHTFLDDDMDLHQRIADLKMKRRKLYEILTDDKQKQYSITTNELNTV